MPAGTRSTSTTTQNGVHMTEIKIGYVTKRLGDSRGPATEESLNDESVYAEYWIKLPDGSYEIAGVIEENRVDDAESYRQSLITKAKALGVPGYDPKVVVRLVRRSYQVGPWVEADPGSVDLPVFEPHEFPGYRA